MEFVKEEKETRKKVNKAMRVSRILIPILIGVGTVTFLFFRNFDPEELKKINWAFNTLFWILAALGFLACRVLAYALRLKMLSDGAFTFLKSIELIFIWEFSSAVSPTNVGGSAVALFVLSREKIGAAKTTAIVVYTIVLDSIFFLISVPLWLIIFGPKILGPSYDQLSFSAGWGITLGVAYLLMLLYGSFFFYGLFFNPEPLNKFALFLSRLKILHRYKRQLILLGKDIKTSSRELYKKDFNFHIKAYLASAAAWSSRFLLLCCLIIGLVPGISIHFWNVLEIFARIQTMFLIMAFSPTPGSAGFAEIIFGELLSDYVPLGISYIIAMFWRTMAYYFFLVAGVIVLPHWLNKILKARRLRKTAIRADKYKNDHK
jgi:uncharacterized membrane protein YbhN (UPF0104 family)